MSEEVRRPTPTVGVICFRGDEVLLIRRGKPPRMGDWSIPGGRLEWNEGVHACALRELLEETGVRAELLGLVDVIDGFFGDERHYVLIDYAAHSTRSMASCTGQNRASAASSPATGSPSIQRAA